MSAITHAMPHASIRVLEPEEWPLLRDHLFRLDPASRRLRFNGSMDDDTIVHYARSCAEDGVMVVAYLEGGEVHAAAELHEPQRSADSTPELAFSVEPHLRRQGVGSALFTILLIEARRAGYEKLRVTTGANNDAMRALAHKFGTRLTFDRGELSGTIDLRRVAPERLAPAATPAYAPDVAAARS